MLLVTYHAYFKLFWHYQPAAGPSQMVDRDDVVLTAVESVVTRDRRY